jgi:hypothetical protein
LRFFSMVSFAGFYVVVDFYLWIRTWHWPMAFVEVVKPHKYSLNWEWTEPTVTVPTRLIYQVWVLWDLH